MQALLNVIAPPHPPTPPPHPNPPPSKASSVTLRILLRVNVNVSAIPWECKTCMQVQDVYKQRTMMYASST